MKHTRPIRLDIVGGRHQAPGKIKAIIKAKINNKTYSQELNFKYDADWDYHPVDWITVHRHKRCKNMLPNGRKSFIN